MTFIRRSIRPDSRSRMCSGPSLKYMDSRRHLEYTGVHNDVILRNLVLLTEMGKDVLIRVPVIPSITDTIDNMDAIGKFVSSLSRRPRVTLLPHHKPSEEKYIRFHLERRLPQGTAAPSREELETLASRLSEYGLEVAY
jgi:pyruvate formate lyase activating enzyme